MRLLKYAFVAVIINTAIVFMGASCQTAVSYCITFDFSNCNPELNIWNGAEVRINTEEIHYNSSTPDDRTVFTSSQQAPLGAIRRRYIRAHIPVPRVCSVPWSDGIYVGPVEYSFEELFEWKHSRKPTAAELSSMTEADAIQWLNEYKGYYLVCPDGSEFSADPINISFREQHYQPILPCLGSLTSAKMFQIGGKVLFPDGTVCELEKRYETPSIYRQNTLVNNVVMKLRDDCPICN